MKSRPLNLEHAGPLKEKLKHTGHGFSEYCFANLFLFRRIHDYAVVSGSRGPRGIKGRTYDDTPFFMPLFDPTRAGTAELARLIMDFGCLYPVGRADIDKLDADRFVADHNPDDADYVYSAEKMKSYAGRKLAPKRNLMKQFLAGHRVAVRTYQPKLQADAKAVLDQWQRENGHPPEDTDYYSALEALGLARELDMFGHIYYADEEPAGFVLACENTSGMCTVHFAKGIRRFKGIFPYMFNSFANAMKDRFAVYNFEQDLGKTNFRKNKQSYDPDRLLVKYRVRLRGGLDIIRVKTGKESRKPKTLTPKTFCHKTATVAYTVDAGPCARV
jgi:hypothetical protein